MKKTNKEIYNELKQILTKKISSGCIDLGDFRGNEYNLQYSYDNCISLLFGTITGTLTIFNTSELTTFSYVAEPYKKTSKMEICLQDKVIELNDFNLSTDEKFLNSIKYPEIDFEVLEDIIDLYKTIVKLLAKHHCTKYNYDMVYFQTVYEYISTMFDSN